MEILRSTSQMDSRNFTLQIKILLFQIASNHSYFSLQILVVFFANVFELCIFLYRCIWGLFSCKNSYTNIKSLFLLLVQRFPCLTSCYHLSFAYSFLKIHNMINRNRLFTPKHCQGKICYRDWFGFILFLSFFIHMLSVHLLIYRIVSVEDS